MSKLKRWLLIYNLYEGGKSNWDIAFFYTEADATEDARLMAEQWGKQAKWFVCKATRTHGG